MTSDPALEELPYLRVSPQLLIVALTQKSYPSVRGECREMLHCQMLMLCG